MYKKLFLICVFVTATLTFTQFATADYMLTNGSTTDPVWVTYSVWRAAGRDAGGDLWPEGWRTQGWYKIEPSATRNLWVPAGNTWVYIRVIGRGGEMKPLDQATRDAFPFWIHPSEAFTSVETAEGNFLDSNHSRRNLEQANLYEYRNGGSHTITETPRLPDRRAQEIFNEAIHSVVWIATDLGNGWVGKGSGVLIDRRRRLVVTNEHVIRNVRSIDVLFPWRNASSILNREEDFYQKNRGWLESRGYVTYGQVVARNVKNDLAIVQLARIPTTAREIKHDFSRNVEDSMRQGDKVHILGNPGNRLWNWTQGTFRQGWRNCLKSGGTCLEIEGDSHGGNSGGPILNGQGTLIGIHAAGTLETMALAAPAKNVKTLLNTVPALLPPIPSQRTYPKRVFRIRNTTGVMIPYEIQWSNSNNWQSESLETGFIVTHRSVGQNIPSGYPKIRFDHIAGDNRVTYRQYTLETAQFQENNDHAPTYFFRYNHRGDRLDLYRDRDAGAAPVLSKTVPKENALFANYPNPFNPETWIPYQLAASSEVTLHIYDVRGSLVRHIELGHQAAGIYESRGRAAHWDGRNAVGEPVASGVYFYTLTAGDFTATRKLLIRK